MEGRGLYWGWKVNLDDLSMLAGNWLQGTSGGGISFTDALGQVGLGGAGIPEPSTALLLGAGIAGIYALGRRKRFGGGGGTARGYEVEERGGRKAREGKK